MGFERVVFQTYPHFSLALKTILNCISRFGVFMFVFLLPESKPFFVELTDCFHMGKASVHCANKSVDDDRIHNERQLG